MNTGYTELQNEYTRWLNTLGFSYSIEYSYTQHIKEFLGYLQTQNVSQITQLSNRHIKQYFEYLQTRTNKVKKAGGLSIAHLNKNFDATDKFLEFLHQMGMDTAPHPTLYRLRQDKQVRIDNIQPFTQEEIKLLQANIENTFTHYPHKLREKKQEQLKLVFVLHYACGLRKTEGFNLEIKDIDFEKKTLFVRQGKGYKDRIIPINKNVCNALESYIYNFRKFYKTNHKRLFVDQMCIICRNLKELQRIAEEPSIKSKRLSLHSLRHSIATHLLQNGMSVENIGRFLGHSTLDSTQIYTHIVETIK